MKNQSIVAFSSKKEAYTGSTIQRDFEKYGSHYLKFFVGEKRIGVEVSGFSSPYVYVFNPKSKKEIKRNDYFVSRYIDTCDNAESLKINLLKK